MCTAGLKWYPHPALIHCVKGCEVSSQKGFYSSYFYCYRHINHGYHLLYLLDAVNIPLSEFLDMYQQSHCTDGGLKHREINKHTQKYIQWEQRTPSQVFLPPKPMFSILYLEGRWGGSHIDLASIICQAFYQDYHI